VDRRATLLVLVGACTPLDDTGALAVDQIVPSSGSSEVDVAIRIEGVNFTRPIRSSVDDGQTRITDFSLTIDGVPLAQPAWRNEGLFEAMVPAGRTPGTYDVGVQVGDRTVVVPDGYTVLGPSVGTPFIYFATEQFELWRVDPVAAQIDRVGTIYDLDGTTQIYMHALAVDVDGTLVGITDAPRSLVRIDPTTARVTSNVTVAVEHAYWGATVAPAGTFGIEATLLVAANDDGNLYRVAANGTLTQIGNFGGNNVRVAGDIAYVPGDGLFATVYADSCSGTCVARISTAGQASLLDTTGPGDLWGLAAFNGILYAFGGNSEVYIVNRTTGALVQTFSTSVPGMSDAAP